MKETTIHRPARRRPRAPLRWGGGWDRVRRYAILRFGIVGGLAATADLALYWMLNQRAGWSRWAAQSVSRPSGGLVSFTLNKLWTFGNREIRAVPRQAFRYGVIWGCGWMGSSLLIELYRSLLVSFRRRDFAAKFLAEATLGLLSFAAQRYWAFRRLNPPLPLKGRAPGG